MTPEKLCIFCPHFRIQPGYVYSEMTMDTPSTSCTKGKYYHNQLEDEDELRKVLLTAEKCEFYSIEALNGVKK